MIKEEPTRLDEALRVARKETDRQLLGMKHHLQMVTNKVVDLEKEAEGISSYMHVWSILQEY
jgi:hypothetical protein